MIIYKATNKINGKYYIGQTINSLYKRLNQHFRTTTSRATYFTNALKKYKKEDWEWKIIDEASDIDQLNLKEEFWIKFFDSTNRDLGYNSTSGGYNSSHSEETKQRISKLNKGKVRSIFFKEKMRGNKNGRFRINRIMCVETGEIFINVMEAKKAYPKGNLYKAATTGRTSCGFHWKYL